MADLGFELQESEYPQEIFEPVPQGDYLVQVVDEKTKMTKSGGEMIILTWEILEPERFAGRKIFENLNIFNSNETAQRIARERLANIMRAAGLKGISNTEQLRYIPLTASVVIKQDAGFDPKNELGRKIVGSGMTRPAAEPSKPREASGAGRGGAIVPEPAGNSTDGW